ncbi:universal stress protein, partial [Streptomyces sp. NPDC059374]|uniref:universal stress protein n=1 Tax=Streptomyces sp. NPDC059374 TaxID=3346814 RepID=UPI0036B7B434
MSRSVLAGVDGSERSFAAADWAAREALRRAVPLRLVHASPQLPGDAVPARARDTLHRLGEMTLQRVAAELGGRYPPLPAYCEQTGDAPAAAQLSAAHGAARRRV